MAPSRGMSVRTTGDAPMAAVCGHRRRREGLRGDERDLIGFDRLLVRAMDETGYACEPGSRGALNIEKLLTLARETTGRLSFSEFVEEIDLMRAATLACAAGSRSIGISSP